MLLPMLTPNPVMGRLCQIRAYRSLTAMVPPSVS
jgi:hypothetical protein